jgi:hypothetical protein
VNAGGLWLHNRKSAMKIWLLKIRSVSEWKGSSTLAANHAPPQQQFHYQYPTHTAAGYDAHTQAHGPYSQHTQFHANRSLSIWGLKGRSLMELHDCYI